MVAGVARLLRGKAVLGDPDDSVCLRLDISKDPCDALTLTGLGLGGIGDDDGATCVALISFDKELPKA